MQENGRLTYSIKQNKIEVDKDIQKQKQRLEMIENYAGKAGHGKIEIAGVTLEPADVAKLNNILEGNYKI
jgi:hypothetical protein